MLEVELLPLVPQAVLPVPAPATTRREVPPGYGVQEQCLPFTAATALGLLVGSPITFGLCLPGDVPADAHAFRSPLDRPRPDGTFGDPRVFYVKDDPRSAFVRNAFTLDPLPATAAKGSEPFRPVQPGLSFFDREDQLDLFKLHLPYVWRTPAEVDTLFLPPINRQGFGLSVLAGLVETDWYAHPVNLVLRKPPAGQAVHVAVGDPIAQVVLVARPHRRPVLKVVASHARSARELRAQLVQWYGQHAENRSAYKRLARSHYGRVGVEPTGYSGGRGENGG
jgi:hypothetical protein